MMFYGIVKLDFPIVEMEEDSDKVEEVFESGSVEIQSTLDEIVEDVAIADNDTKEVGTEGDDSESMTSESVPTTESESDLVPAVESVNEVEPNPVAKPVPVSIAAAAALKNKIKVEVKKTDRKAIQGARNILNGPWAFGVNGKGAEAWGLGTEMNSLRNDLAESCAERER